MPKKKKSSSLLQKSRSFKDPLVLGFIAVFIAVGSFFVWQTFASTPVYYTNWEYWGPRIRACESSNDYKSQNKSSTASGAWQFLDSSWHNHYGFKHAKQASKAQQDQVAMEFFDARGTNPWNASYSCWHSGSNNSHLSIVINDIPRHDSPKAHRAANTYTPYATTYRVGSTSKSYPEYGNPYSCQPHQFLIKGQSGECVKHLQWMLKYRHNINIGAYGPKQDGVDGSFGSATDRGVRTVQNFYHLPVTGYVDQATWDILHKSAK